MDLGFLTRSRFRAREGDRRRRTTLLHRPCSSSHPASGINRACGARSPPCAASFSSLSLRTRTSSTRRRLRRRRAPLIARPRARNKCNGIKHTLPSVVRFFPRVSFALSIPDDDDDDSTTTIQRRRRRRQRRYLLSRLCSRLVSVRFLRRECARVREHESANAVRCNGSSSSSSLQPALWHSPHSLCSRRRRRAARTRRRTAVKTSRPVMR